MHALPRVLAVCVNWNGGEVLAETVASLLASRDCRLEVLVVDNASGDDSVRRLPEGVQRLLLPRNLGYGGALNAAVSRRLGVAAEKTEGNESPEYFLLLNNDVVLEEDTVARLAEFADDRGPGVYGPMVLEYRRPDRLDAAWGELSWSHVLVRLRGKGAPEGKRWSLPREVDVLLGCALFVHRKVFEDVGLFDERFFMYHEEVDFLYRARRRGFPVVYCPFVKVRHHGAFATRSRPLQRVLWTRRNTVLFLRKHRAGPLRWTFFALTLGASLGFNLLVGRWRRAGAIFRGATQGFQDGPCEEAR